MICLLILYPAYHCPGKWVSQELLAKAKSLKHKSLFCSGFTSAQSSQYLSVTGVGRPEPWFSCYRDPGAGAVGGISFSHLMLPEEAPCRVEWESHHYRYRVLELDENVQIGSLDRTKLRRLDCEPGLPGGRSEFCRLWDPLSSLPPTHKGWSTFQRHSLALELLTPGSLRSTQTYRSKIFIFLTRPLPLPAADDSDVQGSPSRSRPPTLEPGMDTPRYRGGFVSVAWWFCWFCALVPSYLTLGE